MKIMIVKVLGGVILAAIICFLTFDWYLLDGIDGWFFSSILNFAENEDTVYAVGYTDQGFRQVKRKMSEDDVVKLIGRPLREVWIYEATEEMERIFEDDNGTIVTDGKIRIFFENSTVQVITKGISQISGKIEKGMKQEDILTILGVPEKKSWVYSKSPGDRSYKIRTIILKDGNVLKKIHEFYVD